LYCLVFWVEEKELTVPIYSFFVFFLAMFGVSIENY